jgi:hypothetical protein
VRKEGSFRGRNTNKKEKLMVKEIRMTKNYGQFTLLEGNRNINRLKVERLKKSMANNYVPVPIIVNSKNEVIDGQHRLEAVKSLDLALHYYSMGRMGIEETRALNMNGTPWKNNDHLHSYMTREREEHPDSYQDLPYHQFFYIKNTYKLHFQIVLTLIGIHDFAVGGELFKEGRLKIDNFFKLEKDAKYIHSMKDHYDRWKNRPFMAAMCIVMSQRVFNRDKWIRKLSMNRAKMYRCTNKSDYVVCMEQIYNWNERNKVIFKRTVNG